MRGWQRMASGESRDTGTLGPDWRAGLDALLLSTVFTEKGGGQLWHAIEQYVAYDHGERNHQAIGIPMALFPDH